MSRIRREIIQNFARRPVVETLPRTSIQQPRGSGNLLVCDLREIDGFRESHSRPGALLGRRLQLELKRGPVSSGSIGLSVDHLALLAGRVHRRRYRLRILARARLRPGSSAT